MTSQRGPGPDEEILRVEAADWFARMRGPGASQSQLEFERWRASDPSRRAAYARFERNWERAAALRGGAFDQARRAPRAFLPMSSRTSFLAVGAVALALLLTTGLLLLSANNPLAGRAEAAMAIETRVGQIRHTALPDGSAVTLDTDSKVEIDFSSTARIVRLVRGRVRVEIAPDTARPFRVEAGGRRLVGSAFDVSVYGGVLRVASVHGGVKVGSGRTHASSPLDTKLADGEALRTQPGHVAPIIEPVEKGQLQWIGGMLSFAGTPLGDVLDQTNRYSTIRIRVQDPALARLKVTGAFRPIPATQLARALAAAFTLQVRPTPNGDLILYSG